jgi:hypothetical protein
MRLFVSGATKSLRRHLAGNEKRFGILKSPAAGNRLERIGDYGIPWAIDNGAFSGFDAMAFELLLVRASYASRLPQFVVCPDVVGNARQTISLFGKWQYKIASRGLPVAFVAQDGQEDLGFPPLPLWSCLFIGGSTRFKLSECAANLAALARSYGKWVHMGRVNTFRRLRYAASIGCDSVDGSRMSRWGDELAHFVRWLKRIDDQPILEFQ